MILFILYKIIEFLFRFIAVIIVWGSVFVIWAGYLIHDGFVDGPVARDLLNLTFLLVGAFVFMTLCEVGGWLDYLIHDKLKPIMTKIKQRD